MTDVELRLRCVEVVTRLIDSTDLTKRSIRMLEVLAEAEEIYRWCTKNRQLIPIVNCPIPKE